MQFRTSGIKKGSRKGVLQKMWDKLQPQTESASVPNLVPAFGWDENICHIKLREVRCSGFYIDVM